MKLSLVAVLALTSVLCSGCPSVTTNFASYNNFASDNQVLSSRSTVSDASSVNGVMEGGDTGNVQFPLGADRFNAESGGDHVEINLLSRNRIASFNQVGAHRCVAAQDSAVESNMNGGDTGNVNVVAQ